MIVELTPWKVARFLFALAISFILAGVGGQLTDIFLSHTYGLFLFDPNREQSILRFYSAVMLLLCSCLFFIIAIGKRGENIINFFYWVGLAFLFLFLAIIKNTAIQEYLASLIRSDLNLSKIQFYEWLYSIIIVIFPVVYLKFLLTLPKRILLLFVISGSTFLIGAFGLDLVVAYLDKSLDPHNMAYVGLSTLEVSLEMVGTIMFVYSLLIYICTEMKWNGVRIVE